MFVFELGDHELHVRVEDTRRVRLLSVVCGLLELSPDEVAAIIFNAARYLSDVELCTAAQFRRILRDALGTSAAESPPARAFFDALFAGLAASTGGIARLLDIVVAVSLLLSGARKSEKLVFAFDTIGRDGVGGELDKEQIGRIFSGVLCAVLAASGRFTPADGAVMSRLALRVSQDLSDHVCADTPTLSFDAFGAWYNSHGFKLAPWLELLDLSKWPTTAAAATTATIMGGSAQENGAASSSQGDGHFDSDDDDNDDEAGRYSNNINNTNKTPTYGEDVSQQEDDVDGGSSESDGAVVEFDVETEDDDRADGVERIMSASFTSFGIARLRALIILSGLTECDASVLCGALKRSASDAGRVNFDSFVDVTSTLLNLDIAAEGAEGEGGDDDNDPETNESLRSSCALLRYLHAACSARDSRLGADFAELGAGLSLLCAGSKSAKLAVAWEFMAATTASSVKGGGGGADGSGAQVLSRRGLWRYLRSFLLPLVALAALPDPPSKTAHYLLQLPSYNLVIHLVDGVDAAAVTLAATIFDEMDCGDTIRFDDFADWYTEGGFRTSSWLELLALDKWVL